MDTGMSLEPNDEQRYPTLTDNGRQILRLMREHPNAPIYRNTSGNRLTQDDVERVRAFEREVESTPVHHHTSPPSWVPAFLERCYEQVPFYREQGSAPSDLRQIGSVTRADFARDIADFVPDDVDLDRLINFRTTGTTGNPLLVASHPVVAASYLAYHKQALRRFGIELRHRRGQVGVVLLGFQAHCFTYVSVTPTMDESGLVKINLHPNDWRHPSDRGKYLEALDPEVIAGDPISYAELLRLDLSVRPRALLSTAMALTTGLRRQLEERFECPVLDLYSLNEAGPIGVLDPNLGGHVLLQHRLYVEILDDDDNPVPAGQPGEITLTGGFNFCLPLVRYRTGDTARLGVRGGESVLTDLVGRKPVVFRTHAGDFINNIDVTHALQRFALPQFRLHQAADGALTLTVYGFRGDVEEVHTRLIALFGARQPLSIDEQAQVDSKVLQYSSDLVSPDDLVPLIPGNE